MAIGSDNVFPKLIVSEGTTPSSPAAGSQKLFIDSADHKLKRVNSAGAVTTIEGGTSGGATIDSGAVLTKSAVQAIAANTATAVTFDGEVEDTDNYHSNVTNTSRLVAPATGVYIVSGSVELILLASGKSMIVRIRKNGTDADGDGRSRIPGAGTPTGGPLSRRIRMTAGDYVELIVEHNDTVSRDARESINGTAFMITRIA